MTRPVGKGLAGVEGPLPGYLVSLWSPKDSKRSSLMLRLGPLRPEATCPRRLALLQQVWGRVRRHGLVTTWPLPAAWACPGAPGRTIGDGTSSLHPEGGLPHLRGPGGGQRWSLGGGRGRHTDSLCWPGRRRTVASADTAVCKQTTSGWGEQLVFVLVGADVGPAALTHRFSSPCRLQPWSPGLRHLVPRRGCGSEV